jgi:hypothetical protein
MDVSILAVHGSGLGIVTDQGEVKLQDFQCSRAFSITEIAVIAIQAPPAEWRRCFLKPWQISGVG